ncbi:MAG: hypothetical protein ABL994_02150 [Verrucomicrobiales bacterium]
MSEKRIDNPNWVLTHSSKLEVVPASETNGLTRGQFRLSGHRSHRDMHRVTTTITVLN